MMTQLRRAIDEATRCLAEAGVASPRVDAEELAAHAAGTARGRLALVESIGDGFFERFTELVGARSRRVPLQHLTGRAGFGPVTVDVGPGVFIPRPETEAMLDWATHQQLPAEPLVVDLCTGSGALAIALAHHFPGARVIGVDTSPAAMTYARRNAAETGVELRVGDVLDQRLFDDLDRRVDLVVANPPYLPDGAMLEPEVARHDPPEALFGGPTGTGFVTAISMLGARWLRSGAVLAIEHDDISGDEVAELVSETGFFDDVVNRTDLAGRPRFVTARRNVLL